jgi:hypothetical protein
VFTARYALSPYIKQIRFVFKGLIITHLRNKCHQRDCVHVSTETYEGYLGIEKEEKDKAGEIVQGGAS